MIGRVRTRAQFNDFHSAPRVRYGSLTVRVAPGLEPGVPAVAYSIGRHVGTAVVRNRLRRQLRAGAQRHVALLDPASAYLITVHNAADRDIETTLRECLRRAASLATNS